MLQSKSILRVRVRVAGNLRVVHVRAIIAS
jgi:hypothetical protein